MLAKDCGLLKSSNENSGFMKEVVFLDKLMYCYLLTYSMEVLLEKLTESQLVKKFPVFHGTRKFITTFKTDHHLSLSWTRSVQSMPPHPTFLNSFLILSFHLRLSLPSGLFPSGFHTKTLYASPLPHKRYMPSPFHSSRIDHRKNIGWGV